MSLYGASAVKESSQFNWRFTLKIMKKGRCLTAWEMVGRLLKSLASNCPQVRIPVTTGRNISVVIEAAAMNYRAKQMGFDATKSFERRLASLIEEHRKRVMQMIDPIAFQLGPISIRW